MGARIDYVRGAAGSAHGVDVDHIYPLSLAWSMGAASWPRAKRMAFANDPRNLLAVSASVNRSKGDAGPADWLPRITTNRCQYVARFQTVARVYGLRSTERDAHALDAAHCP